MKRNMKLIVLLAALTLIIASVFCVSASADDAVFTVTSKDGTVTEYLYETELPYIFSDLQDGDTVTLKKSIKLDSGITISSKETAPREIFIDLAGKGLYRTTKSTVVSLSHYTTLNVYSSAPGGYVSVYSESNSAEGGCAFNVVGVDAKLNIGAMTVGEKAYPGSNVSVYASAILDVRKAGTIGAYCDGANLFANVADWAGAIGARNTDGEIVVKNSNVVALDNNRILHLEVSEEDGEIPSMTIDNCRIYRMVSGSRKQLFNQLSGYITIKDTVTNCSLTAETSGPLAEAITLVGNNVFASSAVATEAVKDYNGEVLARVNQDYKFVNGDSTLNCIAMYGRVQDLAGIKADSSVLVSADDTARFIWKFGEEETETVWKKGEAPTPEYELQNGGISGLYKNGWISSVREDGAVVYEGGPVLDFNVKVSVESDGRLFYHVLIPATVYDGGYIVFDSCSIDNAGVSASDFVRREVDGKWYYDYETTYLDATNPDSEVSVMLTCKFTKNGTATYAKGVWNLTLSSYVDKVLKTEEASVYTPEEYAFVKIIKSKYFE